MEPKSRTVAHTKRVILDVLTLDGLTTAQTVESDPNPTLMVLESMSGNSPASIRWRINLRSATSRS